MILRVWICVLALAVSAFAQEDVAVAWQVKLLTRKGAEFTGMLRHTKAFQKRFDDKAVVDCTRLDPKEPVELNNFNGLNGSIGFRMGEVRSIERLDVLTSQQVSDAEQKIEKDRAQNLEKERARLAEVAARRAARKQAEDEAAAATGGTAGEEAPPEIVLPVQYKTWLDRFPPEKGWIPAKKAQLYYHNVVLGAGANSPDEKEWLDNYAQWKEAYDYWVHEQEKITGEKAPDDESNPGHPSNAIEKKAPLDWRRMPDATPVDPKVAKPIPTDAEAKPVPTKEGVPQPVPVKTDGEKGQG